jgi:hypothetical protein
MSPTVGAGAEGESVATTSGGRVVVVVDLLVLLAPETEAMVVDVEGAIVAIAF